MGLLSKFKINGWGGWALEYMWDNQLFTKLVDDTDLETATLIWQSFKSTLVTAVREWKAATVAKDYDKIRQLSHRTRSSALLLGFRDFSSLNQRIERDLIDEKYTTELSNQIQTWPDQAELVLQVLNESPKDLLGKQAVPFAENRVDSN